jgi:pimeloyl-ACP methyl ester carboxylesterase
LFYISEDAELAYQILGSGQDVVLLHPTPAHREFWCPVAQRLASGYRLIIPDLRGHGQSQSGEGPITVERLAQDVERLLDTLQISRCLFAGCSIGGYTLFELWRRIPRRIFGLAFCCSKPQPDAAVNKAKREEWIAEIRQKGTDGFFDFMAGTLLSPTTQKQDPGKVAAVRAMMGAMRPEAVIAVQKGLAARPDSVPTARTITVPVCVISAGADTSSTPTEMMFLAEAVRNAGYSSEYHLLPDAGHFVPFERPDEVAAILRRFFDSVDGLQEI